MLSKVITVKREDFEKELSKMREQGYIFVREKDVNSDGTMVLEFKEEETGRQLLKG